MNQFKLLVHATASYLWHVYNSFGACKNVLSCKIIVVAVCVKFERSDAQKNTSSQTRCASAIREINVLLYFSLMGFTPINAASVSNIPPRIIYSVWTDHQVKVT